MNDFKILAHLRVSTDKQSNEAQEYKVLKYAKEFGLDINKIEFVYVDLSSTTDEAKRRVQETIAKLNKGDILITTELSRLGRTATELVDIKKQLMDKNVKIIFTNQPFLNTRGDGEVEKALDFMIFSTIAGVAQMERENTSDRTIQTLKAKKANAKAAGITINWGHNKRFIKSKYDAYEEQILNFRQALDRNSSRLSFEKICSLIDVNGKLEFKRKSLSTWFNKRYEIEPMMKTYQHTKIYKEHLEGAK